MYDSSLRAQLCVCALCYNLYIHEPASTSFLVAWTWEGRGHELLPQL